MWLEEGCLLPPESGPSPFQLLAFSDTEEVKKRKRASVTRRSVQLCLYLLKKSVIPSRTSSLVYDIGERLVQHRSVLMSLLFVFSMERTSKTSTIKGYRAMLTII